MHSLLEKKKKLEGAPSHAQHTNDNAQADKPLASNHHDGTMHSRLLTKKQLSEMARGVRELSKRLGSVRLKLNVRTVFILTKAHDETLIAKARDVVDWLLSTERDFPYTV